MKAPKELPAWYGPGEDVRFQCGRKLMVLGSEMALRVRLQPSSTGPSPHAASVERGKYGSVLELIHQRSA